MPHEEVAELRPMLSLAPLTVAPCSALELIDAASEAGYDAVNLRLIPTLPTDVDVMADLGMQRAIERRLASTKLRVLDVEALRIGPDSDVAAMEDLLSLAGALGAANVLFTSLPPAEYHLSAESRTVAKLRELCKAAARHNVRPVLEFMIFRGIGTLQHAARIALEVGDPNMAIAVDALHLHRSGGTPKDVAKLPPGLVADVHLCDAPAQAPVDVPDESRFGRLYPGEGQLPLRELLEATPRGVPLSVEAPCVARAGMSAIERARESLEYTRRLLASVSGWHT